MSAAAAMTWLGHSSLLIEDGGVRVLTDPVLRRRVAHLTRRVAPVDPASLGPIDAVLISHVHRDHLDLPTLRRLGRDVPVVVPRGAGRLLRRWHDVREVSAGDSVAFGSVAVTATTAVHDAFRGLVRERRIPAVGYVVQGSARTYFPGDTELFDGMASLAELALDLVPMPVWGWGVTLEEGHTNPRQAAEGVAMLRPRFAVPIHWGTYFPFFHGRGGHPLLVDPPREFAAHAADLGPDTDVRMLAAGDRFEIPERRPA